MIWLTLLIQLIALITTDSYIHPPTPNMQIQLHYLREKLLDEYRQKHHEQEFNLEDDPKLKYANYEYVDYDKNYKITPIAEDNEWKFSNRYRLPKLKITTKSEPETVSVSNVQVTPAQQKPHKSKKRKPSEIYYRRTEYKNLSPHVGSYIHCHAHVTPLLNGMKKNFTQIDYAIITAKDRNVQRLVKLINWDPTNHQKADIFAVLVQISNIPIRLFQWSKNAITYLLDNIMKDTVHTFAKLSHGLKRLLARWQLEMSNITHVVHNTKVFRPPCIHISNVDASTLTATFKTYPTTSKITTKLCFKDDNTEYAC